MSKSINNSVKSSNAFKRHQDAAENMQLDVLGKLDASNIYKRRKERKAIREVEIEGEKESWCACGIDQAIVVP